MKNFAEFSIGFDENNNFQIKKAAKNLRLLKMAGPGGFEPPNAGTKTLCLTAWRRPNLTILAEREGFEPSVKFYPHTRLAGAHLQPTRSPLRTDNFFWRRMRDSNPQGQSPAVFKTAVLPIRTKPPFRNGTNNFLPILMSNNFCD